MNVFLLVQTIRRLVQMRWMSTFSSMHVHPWLSQSSGLSWARTSRSVDVVLYLEFLLSQLVSFLGNTPLLLYQSLCLQQFIDCFSILNASTKCEMRLINEKQETRVFTSDIGLYRSAYKVPRFKVHVPGFVSVSSFHIFQQIWKRLLMF